MKFFPVNSDKLRETILTLVRKIVQGKLETLSIKDIFYIQPKDSSAIDYLISKKILSNSIIRNNKVTIKPEEKSIEELTKSSDKEIENQMDDFDKQIIAHLKKVQVIPRTNPPNEFFYPIQ